MTKDELPIDALQSVLAGPHGDEVVQLVVGRRFDAFDVPPEAETKPVVDAAREAGLIKGGRLTALGEILSHPLRELRQWRERGETIAFSDEVPLLHPTRFTDATVLEVGSGFGVNLLTLQDYASTVVGVELNQAYIDVAPVLAAAAGRPTPRVIPGRGEVLPFADDSFDHVLVIGALQYMDIERALAEMRRVARPGGEVLAVLGHLSGYLSHSLRRHLSSPTPRAFAREARELATMLSYPWLGRALGKPGSPVYPPRRRLVAYAEAAGLEVIEIDRIGAEAVYRLRA
jgi:ubiquinone/menaquinone biosynthesis C-methylase UbiE